MIYRQPQQMSENTPNINQKSIKDRSGDGLKQTNEAAFSRFPMERAKDVPKRDLDAFLAPRAPHGTPGYLPGALFMILTRSGNSVGSCFCNEDQQIRETNPRRAPGLIMHEQQTNTPSTTQQVDQFFKSSIE